MNEEVCGTQFYCPKCKTTCRCSVVKSHVVSKRAFSVRLDIKLHCRFRQRKCSNCGRCFSTTEAPSLEILNIAYKAINYQRELRSAQQQIKELQKKLARRIELQKTIVSSFQELSAE